MEEEEDGRRSRWNKEKIGRRRRRRRWEEGEDGKTK